VKVGDLVRKRHSNKGMSWSMGTAVPFVNGSIHIVTETRINWIKVLAHGESVGWLREDDWELVNESR